MAMLVNRRKTEHDGVSEPEVALLDPEEESNELKKQLFAKTSQNRQKKAKEDKSKKMKWIAAGILALIVLVVFANSGSRSTVDDDSLAMLEEEEIGETSMENSLVDIVDEDAKVDAEFDSSSQVNVEDDAQVTAAVDEAIETSTRTTTGGKKRVSVCVKAPNVRVASIFIRNYLQQFDDQVEFILSTTFSALLKPYYMSGSLSKRAKLAKIAPCPSSIPVINLIFQSKFAGVRAALPPGSKVVVGDEFCKCPESLCNDKSKVNMRQYASAEFNVPYLPLGPRFEFEPVQEEEIVKSSARTIPFNFLGAVTSPSRTTLVDLIKSESVVSQYPFIKDSVVHVAPKWKKDVSTGGYVSPKEYRKTLLNSIFTLCPAGNNPEAFRIYEAVEAGSIPVLVMDKEYQEHGCKGAFEPLVSSSAPFVFLESWEDLPSKLAELMENENTVNNLQKQLRQWRSKFWSKVASDLKCAIVEGNRNKVSHKTLCPEGADSSSNIATTQVLKTKAQKIVSKPRPAPPAKTAVVTTPSGPAVLTNKIPLITGCGRSGTLSLSSYLTKIGVPSVHENVRLNTVSVSWLYAAESMTYPFEFKYSVQNRAKLSKKLSPGESIFGPIAHLTRHPLKVISSTRRCFCGQGNRTRVQGIKSDLKSWKFAERFLPRMDPDLPLQSIERSAIYWLEWNKLIELRYPSKHHFRLEDAQPAALITALGVNGVDLDSLPVEIPKNPFHTSPALAKEMMPDVTWADLHKTDERLAREIFELAQRYGYEKGNTYESVIAESTPVVEEVTEEVVETVAEDVVDEADLVEESALVEDSPVEENVEEVPVADEGA